MIRREPCSACPYRRDVPSGLWVAEEYEKLLDYDKTTGEQPAARFGCHATPEFDCHGWAVVHSNRGRACELLALRLHHAMTGEDDEIPEPFVPLFGSAAEAAAHGMKRIEDPDGDAVEAMERLLRKHPRLKTKDQAAQEL